MQAIYKILLAVFCALIALPFASAQTQTSELAPNQLRVGVIVPLSGEFSLWGNNVREAVDFAIESLPKTTRDRVSIFYEDDAFQSSKSLTAYRSLIASKKINAVIVIGSGSGNVISPLAERDKIIMVAVGASDINIVSQKKYAFTHWVDPNKEGLAMAAELNKRGYKSIALLTQEHPGFRAVTTAFKDAAINSKSVKIVYDEYFSPDTTDYRAVIPAIKSKNPDAISLLLYPSNIGIFARQAREMGLKQDLFGSETFEDNELLKNHFTQLQGSWFATAAAGSKEFSETFKKKFNKPPGFGSANSYDAMNLIMLAWQQAESSENVTSKMADILHTIKDYAGAVGTYSATGDNRFDVPAAIMQVTGDTFELVEQ